MVSRTHGRFYMALLNTAKMFFFSIMGTLFRITGIPKWLERIDREWKDLL